MRFDLLSLFPDYFEGPFGESMVSRARSKGLVEINLVDIRDFSKDKHRRVDDRPYGGGPGMVLMPEPVVDAVESVRRPGAKVIHLSPQGRPLTAQKARELAKEDQLILLCGHYEGIDQRALDLCVDEEISIGDYVLTSGCPAAVVLLDAVIRFIPGVLGHEDAADQDSFEGGLLDCPHYTRPSEFRGMKVPEVLESGNHAQIDAWRRAASVKKTQQIRPDLLQDQQEELNTLSMRSTHSCQKQL